ncbi:helix-turn-helix domain-containing protein [Labrys okinawensis]|uniref:helix-turn-helix domain-containing protein n=1 Tax=Labrys okinawensis TaxID=346911 RepID=UPI0039BD05D1
MEGEKKKRGKGWEPSLRIDWNRVRKDLRVARKKRGLSFRKMEELVGMSFASLSKMELGKSKCSADGLITIIDFIDGNIHEYIVKSEI